MSAALLDVNVLIALLDPQHVFHGVCVDWFQRHRAAGWATCPITVNGCARVLGNPRYFEGPGSVEAAMRGVKRLCRDRHHTFWPDGLSLADEFLFDFAAIAGPSQVTDVYLLALAVHRNARFVTLDERVNLRAVRGAGPAHLLKLE
jgi:hypothetical protein